MIGFRVQGSGLRRKLKVTPRSMFDLQGTSVKRGRLCDYSRRGGGWGAGVWRGGVRKFRLGALGAWDEGVEACGVRHGRVFYFCLYTQ